MGIEQWKDIKGYEGMYQVSNTGKVRSLDREILIERGNSSYIRNYKGKILTGNCNGKGYLQVRLYSGGVGNFIHTHRLVADTFISNHENKPQINHKDNNPSNNHVSNLEWVTIQENMDHRNKQNRQARGQGHGNSKLTEGDIREVRRLLELKTFTQAQIGDKFGVNQDAISNIHLGKRWKHVI